LDTVLLGKTASRKRQSYLKTVELETSYKGTGAADAHKNDFPTGKVNKTQTAKFI